MKEQLYTIPVNEAFDTDCECPVCAMWNRLEKESLEYTLGPSYMEDDVRAVTDKCGFCGEHAGKLYKMQNSLGLALIMKTHMDEMIAEAEELAGKTAIGGGLFKKGEAPVVSYLRKLEHDCFVCNRINGFFERYIVTIFYLYEKEEEFREKFKNSKGFCNRHYAMLYEEGMKRLNGKNQKAFLEELSRIYIENMKRVRDDLEWFTDKFDYRNADAPWKNSQDALPRTLEKTNSVTVH